MNNGEEGLVKFLRNCNLLCIFVVVLVALLEGGSAVLAANPQRIRFACGSWRTISSPNVGTSTNFLNGVAAISNNNVWAVGTTGNGNGGLTLVEHWDGTQWKVLTSPNVKGSLSDSLSGVIAINANNIWAVGSYYNAANFQQTLVEHWDGISWNVVSSPNIASVFNGLATISAISATDIWAVGNYSATKGYQTLVEHWNGISWSIISSPSPQGGQLTGVTAVASNNVWAVGSGAGTNGIQTLIEHWNGSSWSIVASSGPGQTTNMLNSVSAVSATNIWAVGEDSNSVGPSATFAPLIEHWNGSNWSMTTSPQQGTSDILNGIAVISTNNIWSVGDYRSSIDSMGPYYTLIEHWNGTFWSVINSPNPGSLANDLMSVARVPAIRSVWAVGFTQNNNTSQTLTAFHC